MLLVIDHYDSFTYNIVQYLQELGADPYLIQHNQLSLEDVIKLNPTKILISPGPGSPQSAPLSLAVIRFFATKSVPILGICLGHQMIASVFGAKIIAASQIMHGKIATVHHCQQYSFAQLPTPFRAMRYHSLIIDPSTLPDELEVTAWCHDQLGKNHEIMAIEHKIYDIQGIQFHPESILSEYGHQILGQFLAK